MVRHGFNVVQPDSTVVLDLNAVSGSRPGRRTTDMEGAHGQLGARLTDRLCGNNANRFANRDAVTTSKIATVTLRADTVAYFAGDRRSHQHIIDCELFQSRNVSFVEQRARIERDLVGARD